MLRTVAVVAGMSAAATLAAPAAAALDQARQGIEQTLADSAAAWTAGDLARFMTCYEDDASYVGGGGQVVIGAKAIREMYAARFGGGSAAAMGTLSIRIDSLRPLGTDYAYVIGHYTLRRSAADGGDASGPTTLVFHRRAGRWRIVADHS